MEAVSITTCAYCGSPADGKKYCCDGCKALSGGFNSKPAAPKDLDYLDQPNFKKIYRSNSSAFDYQLFVEGLHCSSCVHVIEKIPNFNPTVTNARVDYALSKLFLKVTADFSLAEIIRQLSTMGFKAHFLKPFDRITLNQQRENKISLIKLGVAGACAGNIMLFTVPVYSGLHGMWGNVFNWIGFFIFLPIVFYSGAAFYKSAWAGLRVRTFSIDLPISVALISGFLLSTINLVRGNGQIYFDSTASFIFLILCSRYILKRSQQKYLSSLRFEDSVGNERFLRVMDQTEELVSVDQLNKNDLLRLEAGQVCPVDGFIESDNALADVSVLNGEPMPRSFERGLELLAGSKIISPSMCLRVHQDPKNTHLSKMLAQLQDGMWRKSKFVTVTDRCAQALILVVFAIATGTFLFLFNQDPQEAFNRALALVVLACPCALALGSPLAIALAVKKCQAKGILIKNTDALERVLKIKNVFLDKTGTLTDTGLKIVTASADNLNDEYKVILRSLEQTSYHPIAFAIRKAFPKTEIMPVEGLQEISGKGLCGTIGSDFYEIGQGGTSLESNVISVSLKKNGFEVCQLIFENPIRPSAPQAISILAQKGISCFILSGDSQQRVLEVAKECGIPSSRAFGNLSPTMKSDHIRSMQNTCMIGDGTNDALALQEADVGIAVKGSTYINLQAADICFMRDGMESLNELFELAQKTRRLILRNLTFSLLYNLVGGSLAVAGFVSPLLAAILMPVSSVLIIVSTIGGLR